MRAIASQITSLAIVYSTVYSDADQRKHQSSAALAFVWGIHRGPVNSPHKWPATRKMFPFDDVIMSQGVAQAAPQRDVHRSFLYKHWSASIPSWKINCIHNKVREDISYSSPNLNGAAVEVWEWMRNFTTHAVMWLTYPCLLIKLIKNSSNALVVWYGQFNSCPSGFNNGGGALSEWLPSA